MKMKRSIGAVLGSGLILGSAAVGASAAHDSPILIAQTPSGNQEIRYKPLLKPGKKYDIGDGDFIVYEFSEKPKMGTIILKIRVFRKNGDKITPFVIHGRSDMPSMRGAHDSGNVDFKLNKKNDYLLPVNVVMPGEWEIRVTFLKDGKPIFHGSIPFDV